MNDFDFVKDFDFASLFKNDFDFDFINDFDFVPDFQNDLDFDFINDSLVSD